jgi:hypothetical protein
VDEVVLVHIECCACFAQSIILVQHAIVVSLLQLSQFSCATVTTVTPVTTGSSPSDSPHQSGHFEPLRHTKRPHMPMDLCGHTSASARPHPQTKSLDGPHRCLYGLECSLVPYCLTPFTTDPCICLTAAITLPSCCCQLPPLPSDLPKVPAPVTCCSHTTCQPVAIINDPISSVIVPLHHSCLPSSRAFSMVTGF